MNLTLVHILIRVFKVQQFNNTMAKFKFIERKEVLNLKKSPDPNAKIHIMVKVALLGEADNMRFSVH